MKFPRTAKILRSQFDVVQLATVFFCAVMFWLMAPLLPVPGLRVSLEPPSAADLAGVGQPTVAMAIDGQGRLYFENQIVSERQLVNGLVVAVKSSREPLTLVIHADKSVGYGQLAYLALLAGQTNIGITNLLLATLPGQLAATNLP